MTESHDCCHACMQDLVYQFAFLGQKRTDMEVHESVHYCYILLEAADLSKMYFTHMMNPIVVMNDD